MPGMDYETWEAYEQGAAGYAEEWHEQPAPKDLHAFVRRYFRPGPTADIGCGAGRDTAWLIENGYEAVGFDPSPALLAQARQRHPDITVAEAALPELHGVPSASFVNVVCETVIMHLPTDVISASVHRLIELLVPAGTLYLTWRVTSGADRRDERGRLYSAFDPTLVTNALSPATLVHQSSSTSRSSGKIVHRIVARTTP